MSKILKLFLYPIYLLSKVIPKNNNLIVFASSKGYYFSDNSKYLFLYMNKEYEDKKLVWISRDKKLVNDWEEKFNFLKEHCEVVYLDRTEGISSTQLKNTLKTFSVSKDEILKAFDILEQLKKDFT